ncbi:XK-related protein 8-like [Polypterus senegalus]|uniref:XK-related protein 8-like n=1 Tax=Polypterus senegalus TaxID=55291 RepID=UPI001966B3FF|nr:XK-related protein 8-like [Polypterus senegalus]
MDLQKCCRYSLLDFLLTLFGIGAFLFDIGSDLWAAAEFYLVGDYYWFGTVLFLTFTSSLVVQLFSWFWFQYDSQLEDFSEVAAKEGLFWRRGILRLLHFFHLGFLFRYLTVMVQGFLVWWRERKESGHIVYLTHDLSMLRLFETFTESTPQLVLILYTIISRNKVEVFQYASITASFLSVAWMVLDYHRSLRSFLPEKNNLGCISSLIYFLWNLLLITSRIVAVAVFTSVLPPYVCLHFLLLWVSLLFWAGIQKTDFMDSPAGEWLYRAMVALILYFSWFNVAKGRTLGRSVIYHTFIAVDSGILLVTWWFYRDPTTTDAYVMPVIVMLPFLYLMGIMFKVLYYWKFHPPSLGSSYRS